MQLHCRPAQPASTTSDTLLPRYLPSKRITRSLEVGLACPPLLERCEAERPIVHRTVSESIQMSRSSERLLHMLGL